MARSTGVVVSRVRHRNNTTNLFSYYGGEDEKKIEVDEESSSAPSSPNHRFNNATTTASNKQQQSQFRSMSRSPRSGAAVATSSASAASFYNHHHYPFSSRVSCAALLLIIFLSAMMAIFLVLLQNSLTVPWLSQQDHHAVVPNILLLHNNNNNPRPNVRRDKEVQRQPPPTIKPFYLPRIVFLEGTPDQYYPPRSTLHYPEELSGFVQDDWNPPEHHERCLPKAEWQVSSHPNCNTIHEIPFVKAAAAAVTHDKKHHHHHQQQQRFEEEVLTPLGEGWFRTTWQLDQSNGPPSVVLKTLRIAREFLSEYYELHRRDAVAMERLTASEFVVDIYGYCGQSAINELANFPYPGVQNLESFDRRMRVHGGSNNPKLSAIKLRMAASIASGLADIHAGGSTNPNDTNVYMTHYDLNPRNIALFAGGRPKINDFNIAEFLRYDPQTNQTCKFPSRLHEPWWRAPEEMDVNHTTWVDEKVDVYALGNILYHVLTTHSARGKQRKERMDMVRPIVASGVLPEIPHEYAHSHDRNIQAMLKAIHMCWIKEPDKRATADEVADVLFEALMNMSADKSSSFSVVEEKELPRKTSQGDDKIIDPSEDNNDDDNDAEVEDKNAMAEPKNGVDYE
jgi:serine/threonine protein kinase